MRKIITILSLLSLLALPLPALAKGVVLNFSDVDISTMVKFISDLTGKNFVMDDRVKGKISVFSPAKLSTEEAFNVFTSVLELKGFTVVPAGKVLKIVPTGAAKQSGMKILSDKDRGPVNEAYVARIINLEHISSQEAMTFLQPMISKDGYISAFGPGNMLLLVDSSLNVQKILNILQLVDTDQKREGAELVFLKNASAESISSVIKEWLGGKDKGARPAGQPATATATGLILPDTRLNALILFGNAKDKEDIKKLIAQLDVVPPTTSSKVNVYYLENADATEVAKVLDGVVKGSNAATPAAGQPGAAAAPQQSLFEGGKISITPDKATNSLVIMASPTDYQNLLQVIQKLDRRNRQVFVQAMIAEVSIDRARELGVQWGVIGGASNGTVATAGIYDPFGTFGALAPIIKSLGEAGIGTSSLNLAGAATFPAILKALQSNGALNVLSTPNIMTSDNKEAEIFVGENVPFLTQSNLSSTGLAQQGIERKDTGITLKIKPMVSEGEYVKLDIYQEISAVKDALNKGAAVDITTTKRSAKTSVVVKDTDTVVIGGLIQDQDQETINKIPFLGDIPLLGYLFKTKSMKRTKTNLMIILTPYIIKDSVDMGKVSEMQKNRFSEQLKSDKPIDFDNELKVKANQ
ncbi:type II secretion system protein GspD, putative [Geotalea daltonii FRC-32]|uniref:Type II secretion system protein GspD, putative n=1 Tax=Geotalea daltonii (strain DSM 22248 / JCM 15807 / FRC-32) TaxID=316067 RepID=B9M1W2_GEODF|nr:type II secretion system protein GspD, putative [Geotalea daltonii FRC-32]